MYRIIVWGTGQEYGRALRRIQCGAAEGEFEIVGVTSRDHWYQAIDGFPFVPKEALLQTPHDYVLVASEKYFQEIRQEYAALGGDADRVLPISVLFLAQMTFEQYINLYASHISIIANNCWGGITYHFLHLRFRSPFINMFLHDEDYIALLQTFDQRIGQPLSYIKDAYNESLGIQYPVFSLGGSLLYMNHYADRAKAVATWGKRRARLNFKNLFFMMYTESREAAEAFASLPYQKKVCFTPFPSDMPSVLYVKPHAWYARKGDVPFWETVNKMGSGTYPFYDVYELLMHGKIVLRTV